MTSVSEFLHVSQCSANFDKKRITLSHGKSKHFNSYRVIFKHNSKSATYGVAVHVGCRFCGWWEGCSSGNSLRYKIKLALGKEVNGRGQKLRPPLNAVWHFSDETSSQLLPSILR
jgi:hypothetical protein